MVAILTNVSYLSDMRSDENPIFLGVGGTAAGAGLASALAGAFPIVSAGSAGLAPVLGAGMALTAMWLSGVLSDPKAEIVRQQASDEVEELDRN